MLTHRTNIAFAILANLILFGQINTLNNVEWQLYYSEVKWHDFAICKNSSRGVNSMCYYQILHVYFNFDVDPLNCIQVYINFISF